MALNLGARLGAYEILSSLGAGGMGEVYRARDTKLKRHVAIKILPSSLAAESDRLARLQREAEVLASLNHPNIAAIYGLEDADGVKALVMELVEGEDLSQRIARGPIPIDEALPIAKQIAEALEAAHEQGIVHRDLKPANIKVRPDGAVKVLDFGLAKALEPTRSTTATSHATTITSPAMTTGFGVLLGTVAYMAPERAQGGPVNKRADIWAFGCVLYEMLTGRRAFDGEDMMEVLGAVVRLEPNWNALPSSLPHAVRTLIQGCLRKDRKERIGDISTALFLLGQPTEQAVLVSPSVPSLAWRRAMLVGAAVLISATIAATVVWRLRPSAAVPVMRFALTLPEGRQLTQNGRAVAMSSDGTRMVYAAEGRLFLHSMSELEAAKEIRGTDPAISPAFSPDGQSLVFWSDSWLKRIAVGGGTAVPICQIGSGPNSLVWSGDNILFSQNQSSAIMRVSSGGGKPQVLLDLNNSEEGPFDPQVLPDGDTLLFTLRRPIAEGQMEGTIVVQSLKTRVRKVLIEVGSDARYVPTGHIVYVFGGTLFAVPFDLPKLAVTGGAVPVVEGVRRLNNQNRFTAQFAFSDSGLLAYVPGPASASQDLVLFDRKGAAQELKLPQGMYNYPRVSPNDERVAFETNDGKTSVVSIYDLSSTSAPRRLTYDGNNRFPIWSGDGESVAFQSDREGDSAVWSQPAVGGKADRLTTPDRGASHLPQSWSRDGEVLLFSETKDSVSSLWTYSLRDRKATPFSDVKGSSILTNAMFSPDGRWVAYQFKGVGSAGTEGDTIVEPFPPTGEEKHHINQGGRPTWSRDGKELFFVTGPARFMAVTVRTTPSFNVTRPVEVPRRFGSSGPLIPRTFDIMSDGRIIGVGTSGQGQSASGPPQIYLVLNWFEELKRLVPTK